jgi:hypothetical protein
MFAVRLALVLLPRRGFALVGKNRGNHLAPRGLFAMPRARFSVRLPMPEIAKVAFRRGF